MNLIFSAFAAMDGFRENADANRGREVYYRCIVVTLVSAKQQNPDCEVALVTNDPLPAPFDKQLARAGVSIHICPFDRFRFAADLPWSLAFYKLCAMDWVLKNLTFDHCVLLDTDTYTQYPFTDLWREADEAVLLYQVPHPASQPMAAAISGCCDALDPDGAPHVLTHFGGELIAGSAPRLRNFMELCRTVYEETLPVTQSANSMATVVTTSCENPELAVQYLNYFYTQEGADLCNWGIKDKAYTVDENGQKHFTDYMLNNPDIALGDVQTLLKIHLTAKLAEPDVVCNPNVISNEEALELRMMYSDDPNVDDSQVLPAFELSAEAAYDRSRILRDITTYIDEMTVKFITGATPLTEYDSYMAQLKSMGIEDAIAITQQEYETFMSKPGLESL